MNRFVDLSCISLCLLLTATSSGCANRGECSDGSCQGGACSDGSCGIGAHESGSPGYGQETYQAPAVGGYNGGHSQPAAVHQGSGSR